VADRQAAQDVALGTAAVGDRPDGLGEDVERVVVAGVVQRTVAVGSVATSP